MMAWYHNLIPYRHIGSSCAEIFGHPVYGEEDGWRSVLARVLIGPFSSLDRAWWNLKYRLHPGHRYHVVRTGLKPGYYDIDTIMLHANMELLRRFVEDESGGEQKLQERAEWLRAEGHGDGVEAGALMIYRWWTAQRPSDLARRDELMHILFGGRNRVSWKPLDGGLHEMIFREFEGDEKRMHCEFRALEKKIGDDEDDMLKSLMEIRTGLWT
jgi:hypothetical protein